MLAVVQRKNVAALSRSHYFQLHKDEPTGRY
jgi:hypothetical protein